MPKHLLGISGQLTGSCNNQLCMVRRMHAALSGWVVPAAVLRLATSGNRLLDSTIAASRALEVPCANRAKP
jgi:hypothetical protein